MKNSETILSIGIIFKNEIRCLERCVKSLQPLRDAIPCQLVMADTGSDDGSREVAEQYADICFDFPWINDFAAARNAVLDRCTGAWFMWVDADEWLDEDVAELIDFLQRLENWNRYGAAYVTIRSYATEEFREYSDFYTCRLYRNDLGIRFEGAIHEHMTKSAGLGCPLGRTILHHDGYIGFGGEKGKAKRKRNMDLLEKELEKDPENLLLLLQCMDSSLRNQQYVQRAIDGVEKKLTGWEMYGPVIFRSAVNAAMQEEPEKREHLFQRARELFPDSPFTRIDVSYLQFFAYGQQKRYAEAIPCAEEYLQAIGDYRAKKIEPKSIIGGSLAMVSYNRETQVRVYLAEVYFQEKQYQNAANMLDTIEIEFLEPGTEKIALKVMLNLHSQSGLDLSSRMLDFWSKLSTSPRAKKLMKIFDSIAANCFTTGKREAEDAEGYRHSYTIFLPMAGKCEIGNAAAIMEETDARALTELFQKIAKWDEVSIYAIAHALEHGAQYPLPDKPAKMEEMDALASRLRLVKGAACRLTLRAAAGELHCWPELAWARSLALSAIRSFDWENAADDRAEASSELEEMSRRMAGKQLLRIFAQVEERFLSRCYTDKMLQGDAFWLLPPMHRFGWRCAQAFQAKERGNLTEYIAILRDSLQTAPHVERIVDFLAQEAEDDERPKTSSPELLALAEQVRMILSQYAPNDPAVVALKQSDAYQKVARLLEEPKTPLSPPQEPASPEVEADFLALEQDCQFSDEQQARTAIQACFLQADTRNQKGLVDYWTRFPLWGSSKEEVLNNIASAFFYHWKDFAWVYHHLADERSRRTLLAVLRCWRYFSLIPQKQVKETRFDDYFDLEILSCDQQDVVADLGAFVGDTFLSYLRNYGVCGYRRYYGYEITPSSYQKLLRVTQYYPGVICRRKGAGAKAGERFLSVNADTSANSLEQSGEERVEIVALDDDIAEPLTLIKMDIEGAEESALQGCARHIKEDRPKLALSVYHNFKDIWKLPEMVEALAPGYRFYLRYHGGNRWPSELTLLGIPGREM